MYLKSLIFFLICLIPIKAQPSIADDLSSDALIFAEDAGLFFTSPLRFSSKEWIYTAGLIGTTFLIISLDEEIRNSISRSTISSLNNDFWDISTSYGVITYANIFSASVYTAGLLIRNKSIRTTGRLLIQTLAYSGVTVMAMRYLAGKVRPYYEEGEWGFRGLQWSNEFQSFPSGHTVVAFALSTVLAERIDKIFARILFYGASGLTAFARVYNNQHYFSDVIIGALLGFGTGLFVINLEKVRENGGKKNRVSVYPTGMGLSFSVSLD